MSITRQTVHYNNLISIRKIISQQDVNQTLVEMGNYLKANGHQKTGPVITTTYSIMPNGQFDMQIMIPIVQHGPIDQPYQMMPKFRLSQALHKKHCGDPVTLQATYDQLIAYINKAQLQQVTSAYNVMDDKISQAGYAEIDVYIGVADNII